MNGLNPSCWLDCEELKGRFATKVSTRTGKEVDGVLTANYKNLVFEMVPKNEGGYNMTLRGSLHKYHNDGIHNNNSFYFSQLVQVVEDIETRFNLKLDRAIIEGIEIGVNISLPFPVKQFLNSVVAFKGKPFSPINPRRRALGKLCFLSDYEIKLYDKAVQAVTDFPVQPLPSEPNLLRVEIKVKKMRWLLKSGVRALSCLSNGLKIKELLSYLIDTVSKIVFIDFFADVTQLTSREKVKYHEMRDGERWEAANFWQRQDWIQQLNRLLKKCNAFDYRGMAVGLIKSEWEKLFFEATKELCFHRLPKGLEACEKAMFSPLECLSENIAFHPLKKKRE